MNFVFHRHLAERDLGSAEAALGAMLPDLWRMADRTLRPKKHRLEDDALGRGIEHHLQIDAWFHDQPVFLDGRELTGRALAPIQAPRLRLFAHVAWEMVLDGALVRRLTTDGAIADMRRSVRAFDLETHRRLMAAHHPGASADVDLALERLAQLLASLEQGDWIAGYASGAGLAARLEGVRKRFGFARFEGASRAGVAERFERLLEQAEARLPELLER